MNGLLVAMGVLLLFFAFPIASAADIEISDIDGIVEESVNYDIQEGGVVKRELVFTNRFKEEVVLNLKIDGDVSEILSIPNTVTVSPESEVSVELAINSSMPGVRSGKLLISGPSYERELDIELFIQSTSESFVELSVVVENKNIKGGGDVNFKVAAFNLGQLRRYNLILQYDLLDPENKSVFQKSESVVIERTISLIESLPVPDDVPSGIYQLQVEASTNDKFVVARDSFNVGGTTPRFVALVSFYFPVFIVVFVVTAIVLLVAYYFVYVRKKLFNDKMKELQKNSMYPFPDFSLLPQNKNAYVGLVADTEEKAYMDYTQLNRHTLMAGGTGSGKTLTGMAVVEELLQKKIGVVVFDPVGQWTGFAKPNSDNKMKKRFKKYGMGHARGYDISVLDITKNTMNLDIVHYLTKKKLTILRLDKLRPKDADLFIEKSLEQIYRAQFSETDKVRALLVLDEVHRLLPKYGGRKAYKKLEQAVREFRKWGVGLLMISQVLTDFKGAIRGNIGTEVQLHSRYEGDIKRVRERHGKEISELVPKMPIGLGIVESIGYNKGNPYFIDFRVIYHSQFKLSEKEIKNYVKKEVPVLLSGSNSKNIKIKDEKNDSGKDEREFGKDEEKISKKKVKKRKK